MRTLLRLFGRVRRQFSRLPHWARDLYGIVSYVNVVELVPTVATIGIAPRHFFRRLPDILAGRRAFYLTPVKFFVSFSALFLSLFYLRFGEMSQVLEQSEALLYLPLLIPLTPPLMVLLGLGTWLLYQIPRIAPNGDMFPQPNGGMFKLLVDPRTYLNLNVGRFVWGLFYLSIYFLAIWQLVQVLIALNFLGVVYLVGTLGEGHQAVKAIVILLGVGLTALGLHALVLYPYQEMLRASLRCPTRAVFQGDVFELKESVDEFLAIPDDDPYLDAHALVLYERMQQQARKLVRVMEEQSRDFQLGESDIRHRMEVHREAFKVEELRRKLQCVSQASRQPIEFTLNCLDPPQVPVLKKAA